jgi:hypothetical protein
MGSPSRSTIARRDPDARREPDPRRDHDARRDSDDVPTEDNIGNRAFTMNDLAPRHATTESGDSANAREHGDLIDLVNDDDSAFRQLELIERFMDRKRRPLVPAWQSGRYLSDRLTKAFLLPVIETSKYNPLLNRVHCVTNANKTTDTRALLPVELSSRDMFNFWWSSVLLDLLDQQRKAMLGPTIVESWIHMFRLAVQRCTADRNIDTPERSWVLTANALLNAFYSYATTGAASSLADLDWKKAEAALLLFHPSSSSTGGGVDSLGSHDGSTSRGPVGRPHGGSNSANKRKPSADQKIPWSIDWLERHDYPMPVKAFVCQKCGERGFNASRCPCRDGKSPAAGKRHRATDESSSAGN